MQKRAAIYIRVSTQEQAREGYSVAAQEERLKSYAASKDYAVHKVYTDPGFSGANLDRPGIQQLINDCQTRAFDVVLVYKLDRISRSQKNTLHLIQDIFKPNNVDFISLQESFDTSTSFGVAMVGILSVFAELERSTIAERVSMGREERAKQGYYHGGGNHDPLGYDYIDGMLNLNEYEALIVKDIFSLYIGGHSMNATCQIIRKKYPDRIKSWTIVKDVIKNPLYTGKVRFNGNTYAGKHEAIITQSDFDTAQMIRNKRSSKIYGTNKQKGLLVGKLYCSKCGARYGRVASGSKKYRYVYYKCYSRVKKATNNMIKDPNCDNLHWKEEQLESLVVEHIKNLDIAEVINRPKDQKQEVYAKEIASIDSQIERLIDLYTLGNIDPAILNNRIEKLNKEKSNLVEFVRTDEQKRIEESRLREYQLIDWSSATLETKIQAVNSLIKRIDIDDNNVSITWNF